MTQITLPDAMTDAIEQLIKDYPENGYQNIEEYVREAVRKSVLPGDF